MNDILRCGKTAGLSADQQQWLSFMLLAAIGKSRQLLEQRLGLFQIEARALRKLKHPSRSSVLRSFLK